MVVQFVALACLVAVAQAGIVAPVAAPLVAAKLADAEFDPHPQYTYAYDVQDSLTGDSKNQFETRNGDIVQGRYSLIEADGTRRVVDYTADPINGFNAVVHREPAVIAAAPVAKVVAPAPILSPVAPAPIVSPVARFAAPAPFVGPVSRVIAPGRVLTAAPLASAVLPARVSAPYALPVAAKVASPIYPFAAKVVSPVAPFAAPFAYRSPVAAPFAKVVSPFGYSAPYTTIV